MVPTCLPFVPKEHKVENQVVFQWSLCPSKIFPSVNKTDSLPFLKFQKELLHTLFDLRGYQAQHLMVEIPCGILFFSTAI